MRREKYQIFTPEKIVSELLDYVEYKKNLYGKKVLENSCGEGNILLEVIKRYIEESIENGLEKEKIKLGLEKDIYGIEYYRSTYEICLKNLDNLAKKYDITDVKWNLFCEDSLKIQLNKKFDFIIGNPPYLTYSDLKKDERKYLKEKYKSCNQGKFDYCYAFIEDSLEKLEDNGKLGYLIPNSIFKTVFGKNLREIMIKDLQKIIDYSTKQLFSALISSAIIVCKKNYKENKIEYSNVVKNKKIKLCKSDLKEKWIFEKIENVETKKRFGDYFKVSNSIATLLNEAYILKEFQVTDEGILKNGLLLEKEVIRKAFSPRGISLKREELIIFPYKYDEENKLQRYNEEEFEKKYPNLVKYLKSHNEKLLKRKADLNSKWFEYGRSQALAHLNCEKLLISTVVTNKINVHILLKDEIPYSGLYVVALKEYSLNKAKKLLESKEFQEYVDKIGININGGSRRITSKDIENFYFKNES